jgi:hypothetical protein
MSVRDTFFNLGVAFESVTKPDELAKFFDMVSPVHVGKDLIRVGGVDDGGYLLPDDFDGIEACFSPGVADNATFEEAIAHRGIKSFLADYSVDNAPVENDMFTFDKKFLGDRNDDIFIRLEDWVNDKVPSQNDLLLQMDIEGAEYEVLLDTPDDILKRFRMIVIEFHAMHMLYTDRVFPFINQCFKKLNRQFSVAHIHPNNCCPVYKYHDFEVPKVIEFTFYRTDRAEISTQKLDFPHKLDVPNVKTMKDIVLPECWRE